jgi:hypothetical protein
MHGESSGGGCMNAAYKGIGALNTPQYSQSVKERVYSEAAALDKKTKSADGTHNTIDRVFQTMQHDGTAGAPMSFNAKNGNWNPGIEKTLTDLTKGSHDWQFFGVSASAGHHSGIIAADNTGASPKFYWMDQYSKGFGERRPGYGIADKTEVTGKLDETVSKIGPNRTKIWPLYNAAH